MSTQKVLYVINNIDWFWSHRLPLAKGAVKAGYDVGIVVTGAASDAKLADHGLRGIELPAMDKGLGPLTVAKAIWQIHQIIKAEQPDIVHVITVKYAFLAGLAAWFHPRVKIVHLIAGLGYLFSGQTLRSKILRALVHPLLRMALRRKKTEVIFQNPDDMAIMLQDGLADPAHSHLIRGSGVDIEEFAPRTDIPDSDPPIVVMPTRLVHDKGVSVFVNAARLLRDRGVAVQMHIAGGLTDYNPLAISEAEMEAMVADGAASWLGRVSDMPELLARATLVAYPSHYREGIPKVLLESCAMGKAIITTDHPGCREAVRDGYNGLLVPVKDAAALADAIERLLADSALRTKMGGHSRQRAEDEFAAELIVAQTLAVYDAFNRT